MATWLQEFEAKLNNLVASRGAVQTASDPAQTAINYIRGMNSLYAQGYAEHAKTVVPGSVKGSGGIKGALKGVGGGALWTLNEIERPLSGITSVFNKALDNSGGSDVYGPKGDTGNYLQRLGHEFEPLYETFRHPADTVKAFDEGFAGPKGSTFVDASGTSKPAPTHVEGPFTHEGYKGAGAAIGDFGFAATADPLNLINPVKVVKYGIQAGKDLLRPGQKIVADVAADGTSKVPTESKAATTFLAHLKDTLPPADVPFQITEKPPTFGTREFHVSPTGETATRRVLALPGPSSSVIAGRAQAKSLQDAISKVPNLKYSPDLKVGPTWREILQDAPVAKTATKVEAPVAKAVRASKAAGLESGKARVQAMYQHLLTNPETSRVQIKIGGRTTTTTVAALQAMVRKTPAQAEMVKQVIVNHAMKLAKLSKEELTTEFPEGLKVRFAGRSGVAIPDSGIDVDALQRLLETGNVPKTALAHGTTEAGTNPRELGVARHAIHDVSDLPNLSLRRLTGEHVSVADFLGELGVKVNPIGNKVEDLMASLAAKAPETAAKSGKSVFKTGRPTIPTGAEAVKATPAQIKKIIGLTNEEKKAWLAEHAHLDSEDAKAILRTKTISGFNKKVAELRAAKGGSINSIEDLVAAVGDKRANAADLKDLLDLTGAKTVAGVRQQFNKVIKNLAEAEKSMLNVDKVLTPPDLAASAAERAASKVVPAEQIVSNVVTHGTDPMLVVPKEALDPTQAELLKESLTNGIAKNFIDPKNRAKYGFETNRGVKRTMGDYSKGYARHLQAWNAYAQFNAFRSLVSKGVSSHVADKIAAAGAKVTGTAGIFARGSVMYDFVMPVLRAQERILKNEGIPPILGDKATGPLLSTLDVIDSLPRSFVIQHLFDATPRGRQVLFTQFAEIAEELLHHGMGTIDEPTMREQIANILTQPIRRLDKSKPDFYSNFGKRFAYLGAKGGKHAQTAADELKNAVDTFSEALPEIMQRYNNNLATYGLKFGESVDKISNETINRVSKMFTDPAYSPGDIVEMSTKVDRLGESIAKEFGVVDPWATQAGVQTAATKLADILPPEVQAEAKAAKEFSMAEMGNLGEALKAQKVAKVGTKLSASDSTAVDALMDAQDIRDLGARIEASLSYRLFRGFAPHIGNADLHPMLVGQINAHQYQASKIAGALNRVSKQFKPDVLLAAFHEMQNGTIPAEGIVKQAYDAFKPAVDNIFDSNHLANFFNRNGVTVRDINAKMAKYHIHPQYVMKDIEDWRHFDTKDPLDLISRFHAAAQSALAERTLGNRISEKFGSATAKPGFVRVTGQKSRLMHIIDTSRYYPKEIAEQFNVLDRALMDFNKPNSQNLFLKKFDSVFHSLKAGLTVYRPGHHIRNFVGDSWFSWMAGVNDPTVYKDAAKILFKNHGRYTDFDTIRNLQELGIDPGKVGEGAYKVKIGGKIVTLTHQDVYRLATQSGIITDYHTIEDISHTNNVQAFLTKVSPFRGKLHHVATSTSEVREHYVRLAHFIDILKKGNFKDITTAGEDAGAIVRKWHPDGSDLGGIEKATARRVFLFYSWMRKAIPLVVESAVQNPGKFVMYPKAYYAVAQSMGIDLNGFGDPYPTDQLFPEWIRDNVEGPITGSAGNYYAAHPGVPSADIMNEFLQNPGQAGHSVLASLNPAIRIPIEQMLRGQNAPKGTNLGTGAPVQDYTDYVDQNVPGLGTISGLLNRSASSGFTQPTNSVGKGNESGGPDGLAFINWLTGGGLQDISRPNYIKSAKYEAQQRARGK